MWSTVGKTSDLPKGQQQVDSRGQAGRPAASEGEAQEESVGEAPMCQGLRLDHGARPAGAGPSLGPGTPAGSSQWLPASPCKPLPIWS